MDGVCVASICSVVVLRKSVSIVAGRGMKALFSDWFCQI